MCVCCGGTRGSGVLSSSSNVPEMSVVRVGRVCDMCMGWARGGVVWEVSG